MKILLPILVIFFFPSNILYSNFNYKIKNDINQLHKADVVIVFGANVTSDDNPTPLLQERLDAGIKIWQSGKADKIVLSNMPEATRIMDEYLIKNKVPEDVIELDTQADKTPDTCRFEAVKHPEHRSVIFVSQSFHLPRLIFQCSKIGIEGEGYRAELITDDKNSNLNYLEILTIRMNRNIREAWLTWLAVLNIYK